MLAGQRSVHLCVSWTGSGFWKSSVPDLKSVSVFICALTILPVSPLCVVFMPVAPFSVSILFLIFVTAAAPVMFMACVASIIPVISGRRSAAAAASVRRLAPQASSCGGASSYGLTGAPLQAGGAQGVEEEALVGAPQWTFQPDRRVFKRARK